MQTEAVSVRDQGEFGTTESSRLPFLLAALGLLPLWFVACRYLSAEWSFNEQYNYGWFVPFFAAYLFWERWRDRPEPEASLPAVGLAKEEGQRTEDRGHKSQVSGHRPDNRQLITDNGKAVALIIFCSLLLLPLRVFEIGSGDWRPLGWIHVAAIATITLAVIYLIGGRPWLRHFSFPVLFFFIAVPWITPIETPIVQGFMRIIAKISAETLALLGVPVEVEGNLLRLPSGLVGVSEACSGVRSFQTSLMIGLFFGEVQRLRLWPRVALVAGAAGIGLFANFIRASALVWIASRNGLSAVGRWHDIFGYAIVVLVFVGTMWLASRWKTRDDTPRSHLPTPVSHLRSSLFLLLCLWAVAVEVAAESWYRVHEQNLVARPSWSVRWPENASGYHEIKVDPDVRNMLRFNSGREVSWTSTGDTPSAAPSMFDYLFFFRWNAGSGTILRGRAHRPDICLPAAGWKQVGEGRLTNYPVQDNFSLPFRRFDFVKETSNGLALHAAAFFTLHEDVSHESERATDDNAGFYSNWDWADRWRVVRNGIRNRGQQVFELIMVEPETNEPTVEREFASILPKLIEPNAAPK